jgi:hypothetical protein
MMGGQPWAQAPEQVDREDVSASNRYRLFPLGPTRNVPRLPLAVPTVTGWADCVVLAEVDGVELFEQAAASRPMATTTIVALPILELTMSSSTLPPNIASDSGTTVERGRGFAEKGLRMRQGSHWARSSLTEARMGLS